MNKILDIDELNKEIDQEVENRFNLKSEDRENSKGTASSGGRVVVERVKFDESMEWYTIRTFLLLFGSILTIAVVPASICNYISGKDKYEISGIHEVKISNVKVYYSPRKSDVYMLSLNDIHENKTYEIKVHVGTFHDDNVKRSNFIMNLCRLWSCSHSNKTIKANFDNYTILKSN